MAVGGYPKPDLVAYDGISTASYNSFLGTSAAAPHVAGAAAILLSANPSWAIDQVRTQLEGCALDMGSPGMDNQYGHGRLNLGLPPGEYYHSWLPILSR